MLKNKETDVPKKILIVDDNYENLEVFSMLVRYGGYSPIKASNGSEGVMKAKKEKPHLILMDIQMPEMNGLEAVKILRDEPSTRHIPSIAVTAYDLRKEEFIRHGFDDYLQKPVNIVDLLKVIDKYLMQEN